MTMKGMYSALPVICAKLALCKPPTKASPWRMKGMNQKMGKTAQKTIIAGYASRAFMFLITSFQTIERLLRKTDCWYAPSIMVMFCPP